MSAPRSLLARAAVADLVPLEAVMDADYPNEWRQMATVLYLQLRALPEFAPLGDARVAPLALHLTEGLRAEIGGSQPYLSKGQGYELSLRDRQILDDFKGHNQEELARKYGLTVRQVYNILDTQLRIERARRQGTLPLDD